MGNGKSGEGMRNGHTHTVLFPRRCGIGEHGREQCFTLGSATRQEAQNPGLKGQELPVGNPYFLVERSPVGLLVQ